MQHTRLYLVRHGQVEGYQEKRYNGQGNVPLTALGRAQSEAVARSLAKTSLAGVYSSDLDRCLYAAEAIAGDRGLTVNASSALRELHIGEWEGTTWAELQRMCPDTWQSRLQDIVGFRVPGGESLQDAADRVRPHLQQILSKHQGEEIVVVAHGGINRIILLDAIGAPLGSLFSIEQDYGCCNIVDYFPDGNRLVRLLNGQVSAVE